MENWAKYSLSNQTVEPAQYGLEINFKEQMPNLADTV